MGASTSYKNKVIKWIGVINEGGTLKGGHVREWSPSLISWAKIYICPWSIGLGFSYLMKNKKRENARLSFILHMIFWRREWEIIIRGSWNYRFSKGERETTYNKEHSGRDYFCERETCIPSCWPEIIGRSFNGLIEHEILEEYQWENQGR